MTSDQDENSGQDPHTCYRQFIPGLVSIDTSRRLSEMSRNYASVHGYIATGVCVVGVLFNSAGIVVLTRKHMASSTNILLKWIAIVDLLKMLCYLPFAVQFYIVQSLVATWGPFSTPHLSWVHFLLFYTSFTLVCHSISVWLTIALAIFRYIYISHPTRGAYYCSQRRAKVVVVVVVVLTLVACGPNYAVITYVYFPGLAALRGLSAGRNVSTTTPPTVGDYYVNSTATPGDPSSAHAASDDGFYHLYQRRSVLVNVNFWIHAILLKVIPCFLLTTLTLLLVNAITRAHRNRLKLTNLQLPREGLSRQGEHNRTTRMLLAVVVLFTIMELPHGILVLMNIFAGKCFIRLVYNKLGDLLDLMVLVNSGLNFVIYCTMSRQFRHTFVRIFKQKWLELSTLMSMDEGVASSRKTGRETSATIGNNADHITFHDTTSVTPARAVSAGSIGRERSSSRQIAGLDEETAHTARPLETEV